MLASRLPSRAAPALIPIALAAKPVPNFPRLRALALFRRRSVERAELPCRRRPKITTIPEVASLLDHLVDAGTERSAEIRAMLLPVLEREIGGMLQLALADFQNAPLREHPVQTTDGEVLPGCATAAASAC